MPEDKHARAFRQSKMEPGEEVVASVSGYIGKIMGSGGDTQHNGALIVTQRRVAFYRKGIFGEVLETMPLKSITSVEQKSTMGHRVLRLHTSHDHLEFKTFDKSGYEAVVGALESGRASSSTAPTPSAASESPLVKLKQLGELKAAGVISDTEFEAKKAELLKQV